MRVLLHLAQEGEILSVPVVVVASDRGRVAVGDGSRLLLELPPVAVAVVTLDLVRGAGGAPEETVWEFPQRPCLSVHEATALAGLAILGGGMYSQATGLSPSRSTWSTPARSMT